MSSNDSIQAFYEAHPYPKPLEDLDRYRQRWSDPYRRRVDHHLFWPARPYHENHSILVAGCGTSQAAKHALRWPDAQVIGIDFSTTSIRHTEQLKAKYNLTNLKVRQLPIEHVGKLRRSFDQIICTGVLHHLPDPEAGLRALRDVLEPDATLHLMVYAPYGRAGIYMLQEYCRRLGIGATSSEIRDLAESLDLLPPGHPLEHLLRHAPDFQHEAGLADALLNPQDRAYSVPQLFDLLESNGLKFGRWIRQAPYRPHCGALANIPHARQLARLPALEQYAAVELFRGTMVRHSAVVVRDDSPHEDWPVSFDDDRWLEYVPLRLPDIRCIEERLPRGAAAVLLNPDQTYTDLYLPISSKQKKTYDAIDGERTITTILESVFGALPSADRLERTRKYVEKLWLYDAVVFDATPNSSKASIVEA